MKMTSIKVVKIEGGTNDELLASFEELDESDDERTSEEGCDVDFRADFGSFFGEWTSAGENGDEKEILSDGKTSQHTNTTDRNATLLKDVFCRTGSPGWAVLRRIF